MPGTAKYKTGDTDGPSNQWGVVGGPVHGAAVYDDDGDSQYIFTTASLRLDFWPHDDAITNSPVPQTEGTIITSVTQFFRGRLTAGGSRSTRAQLRLNGANFLFGASLTWNSTSYTVQSQQWTTNPAPNTGGIWRKEHFLNTFFQNFGINTFNAGVELRITEAWLEVVWAEEARRNLRRRPRSITPSGSAVVLR